MRAASNHSPPRGAGTRGVTLRSPAASRLVRFGLGAFSALLLAFLAAGTDASAGDCASGCEVGQWERFETSVTNPAPYADPYTDVRLTVTYTRPDGSSMPFVGFYDGENTWRIRTMPDQLGMWGYDAAFSDGSPGISGTFTCVPSTVPGMLTADAGNPQWFGFASGAHVLLRSLHVGDRFFAANWPAEERTAFLDWAQGQGYNMLSIASHYLNRDTPGRGRGWETPDLWPLDNAAYRDVEAVLDDLADRRIVVFPFAGFFGRESDFPTDPADQRRFVEYTLARLGPYWNVILNVAGPEPNLDYYLSPADVDRLGTEIKAADVFGHRLAVHSRRGNDPYRDSAWSSYVVVHGPKTADPAVLSAFLLANNHPAKPLYAQETLWPGNINHPAYTDDEIRKNAFVVNLAAAVLNFADMNGDSSSGFSGSMNLAERVQSRHDIVKKVWDFFEGVPFYRMRPCQDAVTAGYCLGEPGREYLVYLDQGGSVDVAVSEELYAVEWINARDTTDVRPAGFTTTGAGLTAPDGSDWLLRLLNRSLLVSATTDRAAAVPLDGAAVSADMHVFVNPAAGVERVWFDRDPNTGGDEHADLVPPFDLAGTRPEGTAVPLNTTAWADGMRTIHATVELRGGGVELLQATFTVANEPPLDQPFDQVHLAWVDDPSTTLTVVWRTAAAATPSLLEFRAEESAAWQSAVGSRRPSGTVGTLHEVSLTGLTPDTPYEYRVRGGDGSWSSTFTTRTAPAPGASGFDAIYVADTGLVGRLDGLATGTQQVVDEIARLDPLLVLLGGDYAYFNTDRRFGTLDNTIDAWFNQMGAVAHRSVLMPSYGNHEALLGEDVNAWAARFPTPPGFDGRRNYSFDVGDAHFVALFAVENSRALPKATIEWLAADLAAARAAGRQWLIPFFHVSPFADGDNHPSNLKVRAQLGPLFEEYGVQVVLASHDQSYERTFPLTDVPGTNTPTTASLRCYGDTDGVTWLKVSPGGKLSNLNKGFSEFRTEPPPAWTAVRDNTMHHFARLNVSAAALRVETYGVIGDGTAPVVQDAFEYRTGPCGSELRFGVDSLSLSLAAGARVSQTTTVFAHGDVAASYEITADAPWLSALPQTGATPATVQVVVDAANLLPGTHAARLTVAGPDAFPAWLPVTVTVTGADTTAAILASRSPGRSAPFLLGSQVVAGDLFAFVEPQSLVQQVQFSLDGGSKRTEGKPPFDFGGTAADGTAQPFATTATADGSHGLSAVVTLVDGTIEVVDATFTVDNDDPCLVACQPPCVCPAVCGDGVLQSPEVCDDGGESAACDLDCTTTDCGDGTVNATAGEACDAGGESAACDADCTAAACGDGTTNARAGETCDAGGPSAACDADCTSAVCGDGVANTAAGEACDAGGESATCDGDCTTVACGDGRTNVTAGETCDAAGESATCDVDCTAVICGDGVANGVAGEECDDGGESATCDADCSTARCGDAMVNQVAGEACDGDARGSCPGLCAAGCRCAPPACGDGIVQPPETCDDGPGNSDSVPDACRRDCRRPVCGDGVADLGEACDDAGESAACDADCTHARCGDAVTNEAAGEECDGASGGPCEGTCDADCACSIGSPRLLVSQLPDRSDPVALHGASVDGAVYVFLQSGLATERVQFYLDDPDQSGPPWKIEGKAPYDFEGTTLAGLATAFDTTPLDDGAHVISAAVEFPDGETALVAGMFYIVNDEPALTFATDVVSLTAIAGSGTVSQAVGLDTSDGTIAAYTTTLSAPWLEVLPATGTTPDTLTVSANTTGLAPGIHTDTIAVSASGFASDALVVVLQIGDSGDCAPVGCSEILVNAPYTLTFDEDRGGIPDGAGTGTGFTYVDPPTNGVGYNPANLAVDSGAGVLAITTTAGLQYQGANALDNALGVGIDAASEATVLMTTLLAPPVGTGSFEQAGLWFGNDEDNYVKLVVLSTETGTKIQFLLEVDQQARAEKKTGVLPVSDAAVLLRLRIDPTDGSIQAAYRIGGAPTQILQTFVAPPAFFSVEATGVDPTIGTRSFGGVFASHRNSAAPLIYTFDDFAIDVDAASGP